MTTKYTPGPWYTGEPFAAFEGGTLRFHISQADGAPYTPHYSDVAHLVAETVAGERIEIQRANANLIAAAPELLEALQEIMKAHDSDEASGGEMWYAEVLSPAIEKHRGLIAKATGEQQ